MQRLAYCIPVTLLCVVFCAASAKGQSVSAGDLVNPSFEESRADKPAGWQTFTWHGRAEFAHAQAGHSGTRSAMISSTEGADAAWHTTVVVTPYSTYRLSGWIRTEDVTPTSGQGVLFNLHNLQKVRTPALTGTNDWTRVEVTFDTGANDAIQVNCLFGGWGLATGKAWYDDLRLERLSTKALRPAVTIDAAQTRPPLSKYIYGQFIEHLGRCIYGGIWAEMLEDRKFFYAVGSKESPWKPVGPPDGVAMVREGSFVGEHTPEVRSADNGAVRGIVHAGLGLRRGHEYVGRVILSGMPDAAPVEVSLAWGSGPSDRQTVTVKNLTPTYTTTPLHFSADGDTADGRLEIVSRGRGTFRIGTVSLMPADNVHGMRADTLALLKELDAPIYRWPGGNFVSGYNWKDGVGDPDRRPPRKNPAWRGIEHNDFGLDEFMTLCRELGTEPYIAVNSGLGDAQSAVEEVQYANGAADTPMERLRAENGHPEPYNVKWWGIGNEMHGDWQLGHMPLEEYVKKHNQFAAAMRAVDPTIKLIAVGAVGSWSERMLAECADHMDLISEHFYCGQQPGLLSHVRQIPDNVRRIADAYRVYRSSISALAGRDIRIALDEWNYWYGPQVYGELGTRYFLKDALGIAAGLHEYARQSDLFFMANYAQTVNVIGCIKTTKTAAAFDTTGLVLKLYRRHLGVVPVTVSGRPEPLDVAAAWSKCGRMLTIAIVNPTGEGCDLAIDVKGAVLTGRGRLWTITGPHERAYNDPGQEPQVPIAERAVTDILIWP
jgi:alpha-N-arabinofuranosidase